MQKGTQTHLCVHKFRVNSAIYIKPSETFKLTNSQIKKKPTNAQRKSNRKRGEFSSSFFELRRKFTKATVASSRLSLIYASGRLLHTKKQVDKLQVQTLYCKIPSNFTWNSTALHLKFTLNISTKLITSLLFTDIKLIYLLEVNFIKQGMQTGQIQNKSKYSRYVNKIQIIQMQLIWLSGDCGSDFITSTFKSFF